MFGDFGRLRLTIARGLEIFREETIFRIRDQPVTGPFFDQGALGYSAKAPGGRYRTAAGAFGRQPDHEALEP